MSNIASSWHRLIAFFIDRLIDTGLVLLFFQLISNSNSIEQLLSNGLLSLAGIMIFLPLSYPFVNSFLISSFGGTPGKLLTGTRIVNKSGNNVSFWRAFFRNEVGYIVSGLVLYLGFVWVIVDRKEHRGWHDLIADTFVTVSKSAMLWVGIASLVALTILNISLLQKSINQFKSHQSLYTQMVQDITQKVIESFASPNQLPQLEKLPSSQV